MGQVIALANQKGGVAKTTTTLNLGVALVERGKRVLCVDLDPQSNLTMSQGIDPDELDRTMFDVLVHKTPLEDVILEREIDLAASSIDLAGAELALSSMIGRERALQKALLPVRGRYDFVLIDTPPSLGLLTINALTAADGVIVPVQCEYLSLRGLIQLENTLTMIRENLNPDVRIAGILPTMFDGRTLHSREAVEILQENFGDLVFETKIRKTIRYAEAPVKGTSVLKYDSKGKAAKAYRDLAGEVLRRWQSAIACATARSPSCSRRPRPVRAPRRTPRSRQPPRGRAKSKAAPAGSTAADAVRPQLIDLPEPTATPVAVPAPGGPALPGRDPGGRRGRRRLQRHQPDDRGRRQGRRVHRRQHRHPAAADVGRADQDPHRPRADAGAGVGRRPRGRPAGRRGQLRPHQDRAARLGHGVRDRRRGRRHRHRRGAGGGPHRPRGGRAHGRHRHVAVRVRGQPPRQPGAGRRGGAARLRRTR